MRILITGATGFIASHIVATLRDAGHDIVCCVRNVASAQRRFWYADVIACDFNRDTSTEIWLKRLRDNKIDVVINCVGVLQGSKNQSIENIHKLTPIALFKACERAKIKQVIQISALGAGDVDTVYAKTKDEADQYLLGLQTLSRLIIRPSIVHSTGSYGGTSLFRGLSALPGIIPIVADGQQITAPIYLADLSQAIAHYIVHPEISGKIIYAVGGEQITQKNMLITLRRWLGLRKAICVSMPLWLISLAAKFGDWFERSPINSTSLTMLEHGNIHDPKLFFASIPFKVKGFTKSLISNPSSTQDRWHAKLYFMRPLLRLSLVFLWLTSGLIPFINPSQTEALLAQIGIPVNQLDIARIALSIFDILIGLAILVRWRTSLLGMLQFFVIIVYSAIAVFTLPSEWLNPLGPLVKNIPILAAILIFSIIEDDR